MCPSCRGLFRAPSGSACPAVCPLCGAKVLLPAPKRETARTKKPQASITEPQASVQPKLRRTATAQPRQASPSWDDEGPNVKRSASPKGAILSFLFLSSLILVAAGYFLLKDRFSENKYSQTESETNEQKAKLKEGLERLGTTAEEKENSLSSEKDPDQLINPTKDVFSAIQDTAFAFLNCESVEGLSTLIRDPERVMPLIRNYYETTPYAPANIKKLEEVTVAQVAKQFVSFGVILSDYSYKPIAIEKAEHGLFVDWESWVGYCEVPFETFAEKQIQDPTLLRITIEKDFYFNFDYNDSSQWVCYRLSHGVDSPSIYGYLPIDSPLINELYSSTQSEVTFIIKARFPETPKTKDQVLITDVVQEGWVLGL